MAKFKDITGLVFGRLTIIERAPDRFSLKGQSTRFWKCKCSCGKIKEIRGSSMIHGKSESCGCLRKEQISKRATTHGHSRNRKPTPTFKSYYGMRQRTGNPNNPNYPYYGARGIVCCDRWKESFENFLEDMGNCPDKMTLERVDNDGPYSKDNCIWADRKTQARNTRQAFMIINGVNTHVQNACDKSGINIRTFRSRVHIMKWTPEKALSTPVRKHHQFTSNATQL